MIPLHLYLTTPQRNQPQFRLSQYLDGTEPVLFISRESKRKGIGQADKYSLPIKNADSETSSSLLQLLLDPLN